MLHEKWSPHYLTISHGNKINWIHINRYVEELHVPFLGEEVPVTGLTYPTILFINCHLIYNVTYIEIYK